MDGLGNDFIIFDNRKKSISLTKDQIVKIADRNNIGCDQVIFIDKDKNSSAFLKFYNSDGGEISACGNGSRCVAYLLMKEGKNEKISMRTKVGILEAELNDNNLVSINMGLTNFKWDKIPLVKNMDKCLIRADANGDGRVNILDVNAVYLNLGLSHQYKDIDINYCSNLSSSREKEIEIYNQIYDFLPPGKLKESLAKEFGFDLTPTEFSSYPNYPNPFNPITTIKYDLHREANISITIHNIQGQLIINEAFTFIPGYYSYQWNADNYPSGIYFFNLYLNNELKDSQKMLLVK